MVAGTITDIWLPHEYAFPLIPWLCDATPYYTIQTKSSHGYLLFRCDEWYRSRPYGRRFYRNESSPSMAMDSMDSSDVCTSFTDVSIN